MRQGTWWIVSACAAVFCAGLASAQDADASAERSFRKIDGYRGIWFDLGQRSEYGSKYSGGLGTYTAKHHPLAIYVEEVEKTFFVYGGTYGPEETHLLAMVSYYDHRNHRVPKPTLVHAKPDVNDPHDNPSITIDGEGHIWLFISGRSRRRPGLKYRSLKPYDIEAFERISEEEFTYPQPWWIEGQGFLHLFTKYSRGRELYWNTSGPDGRTWGEDRKLAGMGGHYQMSNERDGRVITAFNMHPGAEGTRGGHVDKRTNLYFVQTADRGETWTTVDGTVIETPLTEVINPALVRDYQSEGRLVYIKDIQFDRAGRPVLLYLTSSYHQPGPVGDPRIWTIAHWTAGEWLFHEVTRSTHNYDMGSLYIEEGEAVHGGMGRPWRIIAPTEAGPQPHGTGGEMAMWVSYTHGVTWRKVRDLTRNSPRNHAYARRPVNAHPDFYAFWADGNPDELSPSHLYFTNQSGDKVWQLPYEMQDDYATPMPLNENE